MTTIARTAWIDDDGSGTTGTIVNNAEKQLIYTQIDGALGALDAGIAALDTRLDGLEAGSTWITEPHNPANFIGGGGLVWSVAATSANRYTISGKTMIWNLWVQGASLSGTPSDALLATIPGGKQSNAGKGFAATAQLYDGVHQPGFVAVHTDFSHVIIQKQAEGNFTIPGPVYLRFTLTLEIN